MACVDPPNITSNEKCFELDVQLIYPKYTEHIILKADQTGIAFYSTLNNRIVLCINYSDIVGIKFVKVYETRGFTEIDYGAMSIISYPETSSYFRGRYRIRTETIVKTAASIEVSSKTNEKKILINWTSKLLKIYHSHLLRYFQYFDVDSRVEVVDPFKDRKLLVVLNPVSGKGTCPKIFKEEVLPIFDDAEINLDVVMTEYKGHALDLMKQYDLTTIQGIVCLGGDGTVHEVINGLMSRPDWRNAIKMPICPIPCGSGNALAKTALQEAGEEYSIVNSALMAVIGAYVPFDIALAQSKTEKLYFFMSFSWGMIADSDIESEKFRFLGEIRFTLAGIKCCMVNKVYHGILQYIPHREYLVQSVDDPIGLESFREMISVDESIKMKPMMGVICPQQQLPNTNTPQTSAGPIEEPEAPNASLLEPFEHQVSGDWITLDSLFTIFNPTLLPYLTRSMKIAPDHAMGCGCITLVMARGVKSRIGILQAMHDWEKERHSPEVEIIKVEAFRFIPQDLDGVYSIDGEVYPVQNFQAQVLKQLGRIMCRKVRDRNTVKMTENVLS